MKTSAMKKLSLSLLSALIVWTVSSQEFEHLVVNGIPIDGSTSEFVAGMQNHGYTLIAQSQQGTILSGNFGEYAGCDIYIYDYQREGRDKWIYRIAVRFPKCSSWQQIERQYLALKDMLTKEFGSPSGCIEKFKSMIQPQDSNVKFYELLLGNGSFNSTFDIKQGSIFAFISTEFDKAYTILVYTDAINDARRQVALIDPDDL